MSEEVNKQIFSILALNPHTSQAELSGKLGISRQAIAQRLNKVIGNGMLKKDVLSRTRRNAYLHMQYLESAAADGKVEAIKILLVIDEIYSDRPNDQGISKSQYNIQIINTFVLPSNNNGSQSSISDSKQLVQQPDTIVSETATGEQVNIDMQEFKGEGGYAVNNIEGKVE